MINYMLDQLLEDGYLHKLRVDRKVKMQTDLSSKWTKSREKQVKM